MMVGDPLSWDTKLGAVRCMWFQCKVAVRDGGFVENSNKYEIKRDQRGNRR